MRRRWGRPSYGRRRGGGALRLSRLGDGGDDLLGDGVEKKACGGSTATAGRTPCGGRRAGGAWRLPDASTAGTTSLWTTSQKQRRAAQLPFRVGTKAGMGSNGFHTTNPFGVEEHEPDLSPFLRKLFKVWDDRKGRGLFHHDITACETKVLPGEHNFVATLIEGCDQKKRPTELGMNLVIQPFDTGKFNFTIVGPEEVIFRFRETENESAQYFHAAPHAISASPSAILINVSTIGYGHALLTPRIQECLPQGVRRLHDDGRANRL